MQCTTDYAMAGSLVHWLIAELVFFMIEQWQYDSKSLFHFSGDRLNIMGIFFY